MYERTNSRRLPRWERRYWGLAINVSVGSINRSQRSVLRYNFSLLVIRPLGLTYLQTIKHRYYSIHLSSFNLHNSCSLRQNKRLECFSSGLINSDTQRRRVAMKSINRFPFCLSIQDPGGYSLLRGNSTVLILIARSVTWTPFLSFYSFNIAKPIKCRDR